MSRNIANYDNLRSILANYIEIRNSGVGLVVYGDDNSTPIFEINSLTGELEINGSLNVTGTTSFENVEVGESTAGIQLLGTDNIADTWDIGVVGQYTDGVVFYTGVVRDASDSLRRWTFFDDIKTEPTGNVVSGITSSTVAPIRISKTYLNNGSESSPSVLFETDSDTGLYHPTEDELAISCGGVRIMGFKEDSGSQECTMAQDTVLRLYEIDVINEAPSTALPAVDTSSILLSSESELDKWLKLYSDVNAATPSYSGFSMSSPDSNYFVTNEGTSLLFRYIEDTFTADSLPDYRGASTFLTFDGSNEEIINSVPITVPQGLIGNLPLRFNGNKTTGMYLPSSGNIGLVTSGTEAMRIGTSIVDFSRVLQIPNGSLAEPSIHFGSDTDTGLYRPQSDEIAFVTSGVVNSTFKGGSDPQIVMPSGGSSSLPKIAFGNGDTGLYRPTDEASDEQIVISLGGVETIRFRSSASGGLSEIFNGLLISPDGDPIYCVDGNGVKVTKVFNAGNVSNFRSYNIMDRNVLAILNFEDPTALGADISYVNNSGSISTTESIDSIADLSETDGEIVKRSTLNLTSNVTPAKVTYVTFASSLASFIDLPVLCISMWFKVDGNIMTSNGTLFAFYSSNGVISGKVLQASDELQVTIEGNLGSGQALQYRTQNVLVKNNTWHHVVFKIGTTSPRLYYDGVSLTTGTNTLVYDSAGNFPGSPTLATNAIEDLTDITQFTFGALYTGGAASEKFVGHLKDLYITTRSLSNSDVQHLYSSSTINVDLLRVADLEASHLDLSGNIVLESGSESSPIIVFNEDETTGIYNVPTGVVGITSQGTTALTVSSSALDYNQGEFLVENDNLEINMNYSGENGGRLVFKHSVDGIPHSLRSVHSSTPEDNKLSFYIDDDTTPKADGDLGSTLVLDVGLLAAGAGSEENGVVTSYGVFHGDRKGAPLPTYSFTRDPNTGFYSPGENEIGLSTGGVERFKLSNSTMTAMVRAGFQKNGTDPAIFFIDDEDTGFDSPSADAIDLITGGTTRLSLSSIEANITLPTAIINTSVVSFTVRGSGDSIWERTLEVDTVNKRISMGYSNYYIQLQSASDSIGIQKYMFDSPTANTQLNGLSLFNSTNTATSKIISQLDVGYNDTDLNTACACFYYEGDGSTVNKLILGIKGVNSGSSIEIGADGTVNITGVLTQTSESNFQTPILVSDGSAAEPAIAFTSDQNTGFYTEASDTLSCSTGGTERLVFGAINESVSRFRLPNGTVAEPSLSFDGDAGLYRVDSTTVGVSSEGVNIAGFSLNQTTINPSRLDISPLDDSNTPTNRVSVDKRAFRSSANQTILEDVPVLYFNFDVDPNGNETILDKSPSRAEVSLAGTVGYTTNVVDLTDSNGVGLLDFRAIDLDLGTNGISTTEDSEVYIRPSSSYPNTTLIAELTVSIKVKFKSLDNDGKRIFSVLSGASGDLNRYIFLATVSDALIILYYVVDQGITTFVYGEEINVGLLVDTWYNIDLIINSNDGYNLVINGVTEFQSGPGEPSFIDDISESEPLVVSLGYTGNGVVVQSSADMYVAEFSARPTVVTDQLEHRYPIQSTGLFTKQIQLVNYEQGLVQEGLVLRSDSGNNLVWDDKIRFEHDSIQVGSLLRNEDGSLFSPSYSFSNDSDTGMYRTGSDSLGLVTGGADQLVITSTESTFNNPIRSVDGSSASPTYSFTSDSNTGMYLNAADSLSLATGGNDQLVITSTESTFNNPIRSVDGSSASPTYSFTSDSDTGMYLNAADSLSLATGGDDQLVISSTESTFNNHVRSVDGSSASPTYSFTSDSDTGMYLNAADSLSLATGGNDQLVITSTESTFNNPIRSVDGSSDSPTYSFTSDSDTGMYLNAADSLSLATGGNDQLVITSTESTFNNHVRSVDGSSDSPTYSFTSDSSTGMYWGGFGSLSLVTGGQDRLNVTSSVSIFRHPVRFIDGASVSPAYSFASEPSTGMYWSGFGSLTLVTGAQDRIIITDTETTINNPVRSVDGSSASPTYSFANDSDTGIYLNAADSLSLVTGGNDQLVISSTESTFNNPIRSVDGSSASPTYSFTSDSDTGMYLTGSDSLGLVTEGADQLIITSTESTFNNIVRTVDGSSASPSYSFANDPDTGMYSTGSNSIGLVTGGTDQLVITTVISTFNTIVRTVDGVSSFPSYSFANDPDTGMYLTGSDSLGLATGGADQLVITSTESTFNNIVRTVNGSSSSPSYSFLGDEDTGIYSIGSNNLGISTNGVKRLDVADDTTRVVNTLVADGGFRRRIEVNSNTSITLDETSCIVELSSTSDVTVTLPDPGATTAGLEYLLIKTGDGGKISISTPSGHIDDDVISTIELSNQFDRVSLVCNGTDRWYTV
jgi:hypothetical protein